MRAGGSVGEARRTLAEIALAEGWVDAAQLRAAEVEAARLGGRLGLALVQLGHVREGTLVRALCRGHRCPAVDLTSKAVDETVIDLVPREIAVKHRCLPLLRSGHGTREVLFLGVEDPANQQAVDEVKFCTCLDVRAVVVGPVQLEAALVRYYGTAASAPAELIRFEEIALTQGDTAPLLSGITEAQDLVVTAEEVGEPEAQRAPAGLPPRDVPTRRILQALTRVLLEKGVFTREELMREVRTIRDGENDDSSA